MAGQSTQLSLSKAKAMACGAGRELGCSHGGTKATAPEPGREIGKSNGKSSNKLGVRKGK